MAKRIVRFWENYKYRFVPWIAANLKSRSARCVETSSDNILPETIVSSSLVKLFTALNENEKLTPPNDRNSRLVTKFDSERINAAKPGNGKLEHFLPPMKSNFLVKDVFVFPIPCVREQLNNLLTLKDSFVERKIKQYLTLLREHFSAIPDTSIKPLNLTKYQTVPKQSLRRYQQHCNRTYSTTEHKHEFSIGVAGHDGPQKGTEGVFLKYPQQVMFDVFKFTIQRKLSNLPEGGVGVFVSSGVLPKHHIVAMYPGTIYLPSEPILLQSLGNPFIFRCADGLLIDGCDKRLSKMIYNSCSRRDRIAPNTASSDLTWTTDYPQNPLNVGQYINNQTKEYPANVAYQELNIDHNFPLHLRKYLPNVFYCAGQLHQRPLRTVVLVSLRDIQPGEELLSSYFTLIH
ncbi:uncharacterized protein [Apostichopus japonicus]|uniref:uncharacterized protein isoform X1 n=1 Tax=Stichopus japonicus TaxID=307972 RepID=UPI003AB4AA22